MYPVFYDPCFVCVPLLGGMAVGACLADEAYHKRVYRPTPMIIGQPQTTVVTRYVPISNSPSIVMQESNKVLYKVAIPEGTRPGQSFLFKVGDKTYLAKCPHGSFPGEEIYVTLPMCPIIAEHPVAEPHYEEVSIPAIVAFDHIVDESALPNKKHGIISARAGDRVTIIAGTPETGLPAPYSEYCKVRIEKDGRLGKISRFVLQYAPPELYEVPTASSKIRSPVPSAIGKFED